MAFEKGEIKWGDSTFSSTSTGTRSSRVTMHGKVFLTQISRCPMTLPQSNTPFTLSRTAGASIPPTVPERPVLIHTHRDAIHSDARQQVPPQEAERALRGGAEAIACDGDRYDCELGHELNARKERLGNANDARSGDAFGSALAQLLLGPRNRQHSVWFRAT